MIKLGVLIIGLGLLAFAGWLYKKTTQTIGGEE